MAPASSGELAAQRIRPSLGHPQAAVDGKTLRGTGHHAAAPVYLLAVMDTTHAVLAQADVDRATN
jgi:hypothetical protein